jgi:hypothetical protein
LTTALHAFAGVLALTFVQPLKAGGTLSVTVTVKLHSPVLLLVSLAEQFTVVTPFWKVDPDGGLQVTVRGPSQLSFAVGCV